MRTNDREIERKYLLRGLPAATASAAACEIDQGYLPGDRIHERIRRARDGEVVRYFRTIKAGSGIDRFEVEEATTAAFFDAVWPLTEGRRVRKRRHRIATAGGVWEIDEFLDRELVLAEIELDRVDQKVDMPDFITSLLDREVTFDQSFSNFALAR